MWRGGVTGREDEAALQPMALILLADFGMLKFVA
jgi:hypothetical protein